MSSRAKEEDPGITLAHQYDLIEREIVLPGAALRVSAVRSVEALMDAHTDTDSIPFWAELWPSSIALASFILRGRLPLGASCLELGCGVGLAGIAARIAGAEVTQTDSQPEALRFARLNAARNGAEGIRQEILDWRNFRLGCRFDFVLGADVLYERHLHEHLSAAMLAAVKPDGKVLLADPYRGPGWEFLAQREADGWSVDLHEERVELDGKRTDVLVAVLGPPMNH